MSVAGTDNGSNRSEPGVPRSGGRGAQHLTTGGNGFDVRYATEVYLEAHRQALDDVLREAMVTVIVRQPAEPIAFFARLLLHGEDEALAADRALLPLAEEGSSKARIRELERQLEASAAEVRSLRERVREAAALPAAGRAASSSASLAWSLGGWLQGLDLASVAEKAIEAELPADPAAAFEYVRHSLDRARLETVLGSAGLGGLAQVVWQAIGCLREQEAATGAALSAKFASGELKKGAMSFGALAIFSAGLEGLIGPPQPHRENGTLERTMSDEHCERSDSHLPFDTSNGMKGVQSCEEWEFVVRPEAGKAYDKPPNGRAPRLLQYSTKFNSALHHYHSSLPLLQACSIENATTIA
mmetsp:Transcript_28450/g.72905  ORF Transcript_28450/g.72905 Transcript_28450/m.72905 type:complete len:357 (+) Transcript_28450:89-1159(+)